MFINTRNSFVSCKYNNNQKTNNNFCHFIAEILQKRLQNSNNRSVIISVSKVIVSVDFSVAKVYISVFPSENSAIILKEVNSSSKKLKHEVSQKTKKQLRKVPDLIFYIDDSLDYIDEIENSLKGLNNPIK